MEENVNTVVHRWLKEDIKSDWICVDATMGRGNDTLFLAQLGKEVYSFDIQPQALEKSCERCKNCSNIQYFLLSHEFMDTVISSKVDCIVFNLGYLPYSDKVIITKAQTTQKALETAYQLLKRDGILCITSYTGHTGGKEEHEVVKAFVSSHPFMAKTYQYQTRENSPVVYYLKKTEA